MKIPTVRASAVVLALYVTYRLYCVAVSPLTTPVARELGPSNFARADARLPTDSMLVAREHLADAPWNVEKAKIQLHLENEGFAYFNDYRPIEDDRRNKVRIMPFALVWFDPTRDDRVPYTVTCDMAIIEFEKEVELGLGDSHNNRIVGGEFDGKVKITGPDGLKIVGRYVRLLEGNEQGGSLYSDHPIEFAYGPAAGEREQVRGKAVGFEMSLTSSNESALGQDMPRISGIEKIVLRRDVSLDLVLDDDGEPLPLSVKCANRFEYDVAKLVAAFNMDVDVTRPTHKAGEPEQFDRLQCDQLTLQFAPKDRAEAVAAAGDPQEGDRKIQPVSGTSLSSSREHAGLNLDLELHSVWAVGSDVVLTSDENDLECRTGKLHYDVPNHAAHMRHNEKVTVNFGSSFVTCPEIQFVHDEMSRIRSAVCEGVGRAWHNNPETGQLEIESNWRERLTLNEDSSLGWDCLSLFGDARVVQHQQEMLVIGDVLRVWFDGQQVWDSGDQLPSSFSQTATAAELPVRRVVAEQTGQAPVTLVSRTLYLETGRVEANFTQAAAGNGQGQPGEQIDLPGTERRGGTTDPVHVTAGEVRAEISVDPASDNADVSELNAVKGVRIARIGDGAPTDDVLSDGFLVECDNLAMRNDASGQTLHLFGAPAIIRLADAESEIEGNEILFDRGRNEAHVNGPGMIAANVDRDLEGNELDSPQLFKVQWQQEMHFDGQSASFLGAPKTTLGHNSMMKCHRMDVMLDRRISFTEDDPRSEELKIERLDCQSGQTAERVTAEFHKWEGSSLIGLRKMSVTDFTFNQTTGIFTAQGKGRIDDWSRGDGRRRIPIGLHDETPVDQPESPDELEWDYTRLEFEGELRGHQYDRYVVLTDRVEAIHGPVGDPLQFIERSEFDADTETAKNSVWMRSDQMNLTLRNGEAPEVDDWLEVVAFGNAELEGKIFRGRADEISFDESKGQFSLKGNGSDAGIWVQRVPGQDHQSYQFKTVHAIPAKNRYWGDGTAGIRLSQ